MVKSAKSHTLYSRKMLFSDVSHFRKSASMCVWYYTYLLYLLAGVRSRGSQYFVTKFWLVALCSFSPSHSLPLSLSLCTHVYAMRVCVYILIYMYTYILIYMYISLSLFFFFFHLSPLLCSSAKQFLYTFAWMYSWTIGGNGWTEWRSMTFSFKFSCFGCSRGGAVAPQHNALRTPFRSIFLANEQRLDCRRVQ